ncbi:hypothetical protein BWQ96_07159 [Gracilariopsis chorda]|uniref:Uncharacterized protein n=1 Tax=Gracilariopsis chorda TaxID=448386 RepID=A0A2V3IM17_9FLOR|nr:hypothetical protein BWQ96_07159 [Gracilariopsis chorda]|eukprot:PXF43125.1 hypothetical protein BWQ96_07159 [Gracilariopsis chorda]
MALFIAPFIQLVSIFVLTICVNCSVTPPPYAANLSVNIAPWAQGRLFAISDKAPFATHMQHEPHYRTALNLLTDFFTRVERDVTDSRRQSKSSNSVRTRPCNTDPQRWRRATEFASRHRGWPVNSPHSSEVCVTDYYGPPLGYTLSLPHMRHLLSQGFEALERNAYRIMLDAVGNWTHATSGRLTTFEWTSQACELTNYGAVRLHGKWWPSVGITNKPPYQHLPDGQRIVIAEAHRLENATVVPALMTLPINPGTGTVHNVTDRATTIITIWGGASDPSSAYLPGTAERNVALLAARQKGEHFAQQMEDVLLPSNIAILAFPLALNLVPVALITDCDQWSAVLYILFSDVLTALPMLIKGIELVTIGKARFVQVVTRMGDTLDQATISAEMTVAVCRMRQDAGTIGVVFICIACAAMVFRCCARSFWHACWFGGTRNDAE